MENNNKTYLITGAAGFIGFHVARRYLEAGQQVIGFDNINDYYSVQLKEDRLDLLKDYPGFSFVEGDLKDRELVARVFSNYRPEIVIHLAAQAGVRYSLENPHAYVDSNLVGFLNILEAVAIMMSSICFLPPQVLSMEPTARCHLRPLTMSIILSVFMQPPRNPMS